MLVAVVAFNGESMVRACVMVRDIPSTCADTKKARLVEVKGPTDSLSQQQRAWLRIMCNSGLDAYVAKVTPPDKR